MKKKTKAMLVLVSMFLSAFTLASCNVTQSTGSSTKQEEASSSKPVETSTSTVVAPTTTPSNSTTTPSSSTTALPEYVGFKVYLNGEEFSPTNNTLEYTLGDDYLKNVQVKLIKRDGTLVDYNDFDINTVITQTIAPGTYTAAIPYGNEVITINVIINKKVIQLSSFDIEAKSYDGEPAEVTYELSDNKTAQILYKVKGAEDSTYSETAPVNPGEYVCKLYVAETDDYAALELTKDFTIGEEVKTLKVYVDDEEYSSTNNTIEFNYGDEYNISDHLTVKEVGTVTGTETTITDFSVATELQATSNSGTYSALVKYGDYEDTELTIVVNKVDSKINSFEAKSKVYDAKDVVVNYSTNNDANVKLYYKLDGAEDSTYTDVAPKTAGYYVCKIEVEADDNYNATSDTCEFYILKKPVKTPLSEWEDGKITSFSTGSEQTLNITDFNSSIMSIYGKDSDDKYTVKLENVKNTLGLKEFKIKLTDENYYFEDTNEDLECDYDWNIIDSNIITSVTYDGQPMTFAEFIAMEYYMPVYVSFTTIDGYSAYITDDKGYGQYSIDEFEYRYFVIKYGTTELCHIKLSVGTTCLEAVKINGERYSVAENVYYYIKDTDEKIEIEFINPTSAFSYSSDTPYGVGQNPTDNLVLTKGNHWVQLQKSRGSNSYSIFCDIYIIDDDPIESLNVIRYSIARDELFVESVEADSRGTFSTNSNMDFAVGLDVELKEEYKDCTVRVLNRDSGGDADFVQFWQNNYNGNNYSIWSYVLIEIVKDNKVIYSTQVTIENDYLPIKDSYAINNRGVVEAALLVSNSERKAAFELEGSNPGGTLLVNGEEITSKTYEVDGIYREKITYTKELYGQVFSLEFYLNVIVSEDSHDFGTISCKFDQSAQYTNNTASIREYDYSNVFNNYFYLYSIEHFDKTKVTTDKSGYSVTDAQLVNDDTLGVTYMFVTINDGTADHILYLLVETNNSMGSSLAVKGNGLRYYSSAYGRYNISFDEKDTAYAIDTYPSDYMSIEFASYLYINVTYPSGVKKDFGYTYQLSFFTFSEVGTYEIEVTNRFNQTKKYYIVIEDFSDMINITVGDTVLYDHSSKDTSFKSDNETYTIFAYAGKDSDSLIVDGKVEIILSGLISRNAYYDKKLNNKITSERVTLDVVKDDKDIYNAYFYCMRDEIIATIKLIFKEEPKSPVVITIGDDTYDLGSEESSGDLISTPMGGGMMLVIDNPDDEVYIKGTKVYDDYSYSLIIIPQGGSGFSNTSTLAELETLGILTRITDPDTLTAKVNYNIPIMSYGYIVPEGTPGTATMYSLLSSQDDTFMIYKSNYFYKIQIGEKELYAGAIIADLMSIFMGGPSYETNADDSETNSRGTFTELTYYIGLDELDNITTNNTYVIKFKSVFDDKQNNKLIYFYSDADHYYGLALENGQIELEVKENARGKKYVEFYYDLSTSSVGSAKVTLFLSNKTIKKM